MQAVFFSCDGGRHVVSATPCLRPLCLRVTAPYFRFGCLELVKLSLTRNTLNHFYLQQREDTFTYCIYYSLQY